MGEVLDITERIRQIREAADFAVMVEELIESGQVTTALNEEGVRGLYVA